MSLSKALRSPFKPTTRWGNVFRRHLHLIKKLYGWYVNVLRHDHDFDAQSLYRIISYKLTRVKHNLERGDAIQDPVDMKALALAIKLSKRLDEDQYESLFWDRHEKKWGELKYWFTPVNDGSGHSLWNSTRPNVHTEEDKAQESADMSAAMAAADAMKHREQRWLYSILDKYLSRWWD